MTGIDEHRTGGGNLAPGPTLVALDGLQTRGNVGDRRRIGIRDRAGSGCDRGARGPAAVEQHLALGQPPRRGLQRLVGLGRRDQIGDARDVLRAND